MDWRYKFHGLTSSIQSSRLLRNGGGVNVCQQRCRHNLSQKISLFPDLFLISKILAEVVWAWKQVVHNFCCKILVVIISRKFPEGKFYSQKPWIWKVNYSNISDCLNDPLICVVSCFRQDTHSSHRLQNENEHKNEKKDALLQNDIPCKCQSHLQHPTPQQNSKPTR